MAANTHTLYGTPLSLYTGKARAYLIKQRLNYQELTPTTAHFRDQVRPRAGGQSVPLIETADGQVIRDSTAIIDYFEDQTGATAMPADPQLRFLARLFDVIGSEGLLRPAMHYRWNYPDENQAFLAFHFQTMIPREMDRQALAAKTMGRMQSAGRNFGAVPDTFAQVETLYLQFLDLLNQHLRDLPYLLGDRPTIADYGMMAPLYAHLGRDPKPLALMQQRAVHVFRWVERMNRPEPDLGEFDPVAVAQLLSAASVPETMVALLKHIAIDLVPETLAACQLINQWLDNQQPPGGTPVERGVGMCSFSLDGVDVQALAQPYRFYLLARAQQEHAASPAASESIAQLCAQCGLTPLLTATLSRRIGRANNQEVWLAD